MGEPTDPTDPTAENGPTSRPSEPPSARAAQSGDDRAAVLAVYLRSNRGRYTDEALRRAAAQAGYSDAEFAAAQSLAVPVWQSAEAGPVAPRNVLVVASVAVAYVVGLYLLISTAAALSSDLSGTIGLVGLLAGTVGWVLLRNSRPSLAQGIGVGVVLAVTIPMVVILVIIGICVVSGTYPGQ
jgi:hypothetical protein